MARLNCSFQTLLTALSKNLRNSLIRLIKHTSSNKGIKLQIKNNCFLDLFSFMKSQNVNFIVRIKGLSKTLKQDFERISETMLNMGDLFHKLYS